MNDPKEVLSALAAPFDPQEIKWRVGAVAGNRAMALAYVDARVVQDRLDDVLGVDGWQDDYAVLNDSSVTCKLSCRIGGQWIVKMDVGSVSEQPDDGDKMKAAFSDACKRAAVKFGVGRFLYRLPSQWVDYDPQKRQFVRKPVLPASLYSPTLVGEKIVPPGEDALPRSEASKKTKLRVNADQAQKLAALLRDTKSDTAKFFAWVSEGCGQKIESLVAVHLDFYEKAVAMLEHKKQTQNQKAKV